jgi:hypothetical protein
MFLKFNYQTIAEKTIYVLCCLSRIYLTKNIINFIMLNRILVIAIM